MEDLLLAKMFEYERWCRLLDHATEKGISKTILRRMATPQVRLELYNRIKNGKYEIAPPSVLLIPKDNGEFRKVYANTPEDRVVCELVNECMMEIFKEFIHPSCVSYQRGLGCQEIVQRVSDKIIKLGKNTTKPIGVVTDYSRYFDNVSIEAIDECFDKMEMKLGFQPNTEPVISMMRKYYHSTLYWDENGELQSKFLSLRQGCSVAAMLSCMVLYELDEYMSSHYEIYYRYSDDSCVVTDDIDKAVNDINRLASKYGVSLNEKKIRPVYANSYFKFLGFAIKGDVITLSKNRWKKLAKEVAKATIEKPNISPNQAKVNVKRLLYGDGDGYSFATSAFGAMRNCDKDVEIFNSYIMDCLRLVQVRYDYNKERKAKGLKPRVIKYTSKHTGGIGVVDNLPDRTLIRGCGSKIRTARQRTQKEIDHYKSVGCLLKCYKIGRPVFDSVVRGI